MATVEEHTGELDGLPVRWLSADSGSATPTLYVHGVPNTSDLWGPFLERSGGIAVDLPGFGQSGKAANLDYTIGGYGDFLERFTAELGLDRFALVMHDWGVVGLELAQREPRRIARLAIISGVPLLPGFRWHRIARSWRTPVIGELAMGASTPAVLRFISREGNVKPGPLPEEFLAPLIAYFDHGTQRAILKLYRQSPPAVLAQAGTRLGTLEAPALIAWGEQDPYVPSRFAEQYASALGGVADMVLLPDAGHWPWLDRPDLVDRVAAFLSSA
jgi:pimeloyl-ACP methyl ester carboxylesterase